MLTEVNSCMIFCFNSTMGEAFNVKLTRISCIINFGKKEEVCKGKVKDLVAHY